MEQRSAPRFLAFVTCAQRDQLDAAWLRDAVEGAARRLGLPELVGLEDRRELVELDDGDNEDHVDRCVFLIVLCSLRGVADPRIEARVQRFLARPTQTRAREYLIPVVVPSDDDQATDGTASGWMKDALSARSLQWIPTLTRRPHDSATSAWARVTEQTATVMARVLVPVVSPSSGGDSRFAPYPRREEDPARALDAATAVVEAIRAGRTSVAEGRQRLDAASADLVAHCLQHTRSAASSPCFDPDALRREVAERFEGYHDAVESIVEGSALQLYETERHAETLRVLNGDPCAVSRLDPILCELYDAIAPDPPLSTRLHQILGHADEANNGSRLGAARRVGAAVGRLLGPLGALATGALATAVGTPRAHRRKNERLVMAIDQTAQTVVDRARRSVLPALHSIDDELQTLLLEWQARIELWASVGPTAPSDPADTVACSVLAPPSAVRGRSVFVLVRVQPAAEEALRHDEAPGPQPCLALHVPRDVEVSVQLHLPGAIVAHPTKSVTWRGEEDDVGFAVRIPDDCPFAELHGSARILVDGVPVGRIVFTVAVDDNDAPPGPRTIRMAGASAAHFRYAHIAHAREDRAAAERWAAAFRTARLPCFIGRVSEGPDKDGPPSPRPDDALHAVDRCDLFVLCWSAAAAASSSVQRQWRRAIVRKEGSPTAWPTIIAVSIDDERPPLPAALADIPFDRAPRDAPVHARQGARETNASSAAIIAPPA